jgi:L-asparagine transporter-like permease
MSFALYTFGGVEMVAITTGESRSAAEIPRAVRLTFGILTLVYLGAITVLVGVMPWNRAGVTESPFVSVFRHANLPAAPHLMNFVVLTAALSGSNAALYVSSRMLFSLARRGWAPAVLGRLNAAGSPRPALLASSFGIVVALVLEKWAPKDAFVYILGAALALSLRPHSGVHRHGGNLVRFAPGPAQRRGVSGCAHCRVPIDQETYH